jgi:hypothetical protein
VLNPPCDTIHCKEKVSERGSFIFFFYRENKRHFDSSKRHPDDFEPAANPATAAFTTTAFAL